MTEKTDQILSEARQQFKNATTPEDVERLRVHYLGRKGIMPDLFSAIPELPPEERPEAGKAANALKQELEKLVEEAQKSCQGQQTPETATFDPTLPGRRPPVGHIHPLSQTVEQIGDIFRSLGFTTATGPEVELDWYNFEALNIPPDHPSRDAFDTFYISDNILLRSQTSTVQIRVMENTKPPVRIIAPGRCFRPDTEDARHSAMFHQVEGLMVDEGVNFGDLKAVLHIFARELFSGDIEVRFRPSYFPFTEPSAEFDCTCPACHGSGCSTCSYSGWLELGGAGMVDPNVFDAVGYDAEKYTGFAFGVGIERIAMTKYGIDDIRLFYQGDVRFLNQF
ncbi:MAG: phenylalanine--tRNA ligase subunit alpha [Candidatus Brocadiia bacterium]